jgi:hypothetical protein
MDANILNRIRKKQEIQKRIEENRRLMELIKNPHIKDSLAPYNLMKKIIAIKKIQNYWRNRKIEKEKILNTNKELNYNFQSDNNLQRRDTFENKSRKNSLIYDDLNLKSPKSKNNKISNKKLKYPDINIKYIISIQKAFRAFLSRKSKSLLTQYFVDEANKNLLNPLKFDRANEIKQGIINSIKTKQRPDKHTDYQSILNEYFSNYKTFNEDFPGHLSIRSSNISKFYQCQSMINHLSMQTSLDHLNKFREFYLDSTKLKEKELKKMFDHLESKLDIFQCEVDDFEEANLINEIDLHFNLQRTKTYDNLKNFNDLK